MDGTRESQRGRKNQYSNQQQYNRNNQPRQNYGHQKPAFNGNDQNTGHSNYNSTSSFSDVSSFVTRDGPDYTIRNTTGEINANKFIELCFRVKDDFIPNTTALVIPDFGSVKFLLSISSMNHLNIVIDVPSRQITIRKKSFVFKTSFHKRVKAHNTMT